MMKVFMVRNYPCPKCGRPMTFYAQAQTGDYDPAMREFYIGDYVDKEDANYYADMVFAVHCEHCRAYVYDVAFAIRNGQFVDVLSGEEAAGKPIEEYENIEEGHERHRIYEGSCVALLGYEEEDDYESMNQVRAIQLGDTVHALRRNWVVTERFRVETRRDHDLFDPKHSIWDAHSECLYRAVSGDTTRFLRFNESYGSKRVEISVFEEVITDSDPGTGYYPTDYSKLEFPSHLIMIPMDPEPLKEAVIEQFIPSCTLREHIWESGIKLSDRDLAAIIYNHPGAFTVRYKWLEGLAEITKDQELKDQIRERLQYDKDALNKFSLDSEGFIYAAQLRYGDEDDTLPCGYYAGFRAARYELERATTLGEIEVRNHVDDPFITVYRVDKYQVIDPWNQVRPVIKLRVIMSEFFEPDSEKAIKELDYPRTPVSSVCFNSEWKLIHYMSCETSVEEAKRVEISTPKRFEYRFVPFPNPFEKGDRVRLVGSSRIGVVETSRTEWKSLCQDAKKGRYLDWVDVSLSVRFCDGEREHLSPTMLEKIDCSEVML